MTDRQRQFTLAAGHRHDFEHLITKLNEWMKTIEQQIKDPLTSDLQQTTQVLKEKWRNAQVNDTKLGCLLSSNRSFSLYPNPHEIARMISMISLKLLNMFNRH